MDPLYKTQILQGHSRPIKDIKFSIDGKFIYSASADRNVVGWDYKNKSTPKKYIYQHQASVNVIYITHNYMFTGDSTGFIYIWDLYSHSIFKKMTFDIFLNVRSINISSDGLYLLLTLNERGKKPKSFANVYDLKEILKNNNNSFSSNNEEKMPKFFQKFECQKAETKYAKSCFYNKNKNIVISREDGYLEMYDFSHKTLSFLEKFHDEEILDFDVYDKASLIITSSKDGYISLIDGNNFKIIRKFHPENPVRNINACKFCLINNPYYKIPGMKKGINVDTLFDLDNLNYSSLINTNSLLEDEEINKEKLDKFGNDKYIVLAIVGGGQDSKFVTTTNDKEGGFEIIIYNVRTGEKLAEFLDHFGPINTMDCYSNILASGAEDATVRVHDVEHYLFE